MTDTERLNWLEAAILRAGKEDECACVVLGAWYSRPDSGPDGFSVEVGELTVNPLEFSTLRDAIDDAMEDQ